LGGLIAVLLGLTPLAVLAQKPQIGNSIPAGQGGNLTQRPTTFGVDRSPMSRAIGTYIGIIRRFIPCGGGLQIVNLQDVTPAAKRLVLAPNVNIISTFLQADKAVEPQSNNIFDRFEAFLINRLVKEKSLPADSLTVRALFQKGVTNFPSNQAREIKRFTSLLVYMVTQFAEKESGFSGNIYAIERQERVAGDQYAMAANFLYSNSHLRTDLAGQYFSGNRNGFGFAVNYDLVGHGYFLKGDHPERDPMLFAKLSGNEAVFERTAENLLAILIKPSRYAQEDTRLAQYILKPHSGLSAGFQRLNGLGDFYSVGLSASLLRPQRSWREGRDIEEITKHKSDAMFYSIGWRYDWFEIDSNLKASLNNANMNDLLRTTSGVGFSLIVAWQDGSPFLYNRILGGDSITIAQLQTWHSRYGIEYAQGNAVVQGDYVAGFGRWRDRDRMEYGFQAGLEVNGNVFIGGSIGYYFK